MVWINLEYTILFISAISHIYIINPIIICFRVIAKIPIQIETTSWYNSQTKSEKFQRNTYHQHLSIYRRILSNVHSFQFYQRLQLYHVALISIRINRRFVVHSYIKHLITTISIQNCQSNSQFLENCTIRDKLNMNVEVARTSLIQSSIWDSLYHSPPFRVCELL